MADTPVEAGPAAAPPPRPEPVGDRAGFRLAVFAAVLVLVLSTAFGIGRLVDTGRGAAGAGQPPAAGDPAPGGKPAPGGHGHDAGPTDAGPANTGPTGTGPANTGPTDAGPGQSGPGQSGPGQSGPGQSGPADAGTAHDDNGTAAHRHDADGTATTTGDASGQTVGGQTVGGLAVSAAGLTLAPASTRFVAGRSAPLRFRILAADGAPVTTFAVVHDKPMHLIVVRRDLSGYRHLHPTMAADGTWSTDVTLAAAGSWRAYADFTAVTAGRQTPTTLGVDLDVAGDYRPQALPAPARQATTAGFTVGYEGAPRVGAVQPVLVRVGRGGAPAALEPYLGAYGHLVVLREGDLGYVHVHPEPALVDGAVKFWLAAPGPGRYRMFFDFQVAGAVHTAAFTATVG